MSMSGMAERAPRGSAPARAARHAPRSRCLPPGAPARAYRASAPASGGTVGEPGDGCSSLLLLYAPSLPPTLLAPYRKLPIGEKKLPMGEVKMCQVTRVAKTAQGGNRGGREGGREGVYSRDTGRANSRKREGGREGPVPAAPPAARRSWCAGPRTRGAAAPLACSGAARQRSFRYGQDDFEDCQGPSPGYTVGKQYGGGEGDFVRSSFASCRRCSSIFVRSSSKRASSASHSRRRPSSPLARNASHSARRCSSNCRRRRGLP